MVAVDRNNIDHGVEIQGLYDGVCYWVMKDGSLINRFDEETHPRRWQAVEDYLTKLRAQK